MEQNPEVTSLQCISLSMLLGYVGVFTPP
jgi:hypothetical protein